MLDAAHTEHTAQEFGGLDVRRTHEHRPAFGGEFLHPVDDGGELGLLGLVDEVVLVIAQDRLVGRDDHYVKLVDAPEFASLGLGGTGHTGELVIHPEVVLESDGRKSLGCALDSDVFLCLDCLVKAVAPAASLHNTAG